MGAGEADRGKRGRQGQARPMGASEAGGGRRDRWEQARLVGAGEANGGRKPPGQIPSQQVRLLLDRGANLEATANGGWTALHLAADMGHEAVI